MKTRLRDISVNVLKAAWFARLGRLDGIGRNGFDTLVTPKVAGSSPGRSRLLKCLQIGHVLLPEQTQLPHFVAQP
jgi:hypothetical protein